jgi:putative hydrolases of HD superfamily
MIKRDLELLYEIGCLRFIKRAWSQFLGPDFANLADHHFRVMWLSMILAKMEGKKVNMERILRMALVHDITESRTGDVHYISRQYTKRDEHKAIIDILENTGLKSEMMNVWKEYEERKTLESKIVKDADWLDVDLEIQEQKAMGRTHLKAWDQNRKQMHKIFFTKSAKKLALQIKKSNPADWYKHSRDRFKEGDYKLILNNHQKRKTKNGF